MSTQDTLCFADYDPVTGPPTVDGYTGIHDDLVITSESDAGYVLGSRLTYDSGSGYPPVIFQGVKNGNYLNLAFLTRYDLSFDNQDVIVIALRPRVSVADQTTARRIDIFPVYEGLGAEEYNPTTGGPAHTPDDTPPGVPPGVNYYIRTNHAAQRVMHYRGQAGTSSWTTQNPGGSTYSPNNVTIKTRSWQPPVPTLTTSVGAQSLSNTTAFTFAVGDTSAFPGAGLFAVGGQAVKYTGKTTTSFTGCLGGAGTIPDGSGVVIPEVAWSIEVQLPLNIDIGGANWINIQDSFGLYFNVIRVGKTIASGSTPSQMWYSTQFTFPVSHGYYLVGTLNETIGINPAWYGTGLIPALQTPPGSNLGLGVSFVNGAMGVGVRNTNDPAFSPLGSTIRGASDPNPGDNRLVAQVHNTGPAAVNNIKAEFRFANWGLGPATYPSWALASGASADQPTGVTIPGSGGQNEITWTWPKASVPTAYSYPHQHQCMWVQLNDSGVNFTQSSVRRNMDFTNLSDQTEVATVSGVGYPAPASGAHDFLLITHVRQYIPGKSSNERPQIPGGLPAAPAGGDPVYWLWIVEGYRRTGKVITIDKIDFEILDETPGAFGKFAAHNGSSDVFTCELSGGGLKPLGGGYYLLEVPYNGSVEINTRISTGTVIKPARWCDYNPNDPWWLKLLKGICRLFRLLLGQKEYMIVKGNVTPK